MLCVQALSPLEKLNFTGCKVDDKTFWLNVYEVVRTVSDHVKRALGQWQSWYLKGLVAYLFTDKLPL